MMLSCTATVISYIVNQLQLCCDVMIYVMFRDLCYVMTLKHYSVALLVDLNADLKHYFSVRHSVALLELSASASEAVVKIR